MWFHWFQYCTIRLKHRHPSLESLACHTPNSENWGAAVGEQTMQTMWGSKLLQASQARPVSPLSIYDFTLALLETFRLYSLMDVAMPRRVRLFHCSNLVTFRHFQDISRQCARAKMIQHVYIDKQQERVILWCFRMFHVLWILSGLGIDSQLHSCRMLMNVVGPCRFL